GLRLCVLLFLLNIMLCGTGLFDVLCHQNSELKSDLVIAIIMVTFMLLSTASLSTIIACYLTYRKFYNSRHQLVVMPLKKS
ncbi:hypothetical protein ONQ62_29040, partial [Salmonella enterica subsp. enterica serovar Virginia]|nr:hypothetical protein [Salmonella enterica subsp. enterica serovar Virginia]